ncbi:hypothetical protein [Daejeonella lutea]|uniref:Esterase n=1 Tax=Daejeonella lutea TaxID=572036 RepID=A0A1T5ATT5_9SPHI|nr:hypothetical protein [Daejeonella lutea]SKB38414.1 hypothetical protein SAMN05661099_1029 [Daejeonella lutea]
MRRFNLLFILAIFFVVFCLVDRSLGQNKQKPELTGFVPGIIPEEATLTISDKPTDVIIHINSPRADLIDPRKKTRLIYFALPNGNSIEWTAGKKMTSEDDWHYDIQHLAAQTRYMRSKLNDFNIITVYLATRQKSWPAWKKAHPGYPQLIQNLFTSINANFESLTPMITLNSHSGGGSFIFGYLDGVSDIPMNIDRFAFIDSDYGYEEKYGHQLANWLKVDKKRYLSVLAYNDSVVVYNGKPLVSPTGGTWYRSKLMQSHLAREFKFKSRTDTSFIRSEALSGRIQFHLKQNPKGLIFHTHQVGLNGFIFSNLSGTKEMNKARFTYFGEQVYNDFINSQPENLH